MRKILSTFLILGILAGSLLATGCFLVSEKEYTLEGKVVADFDRGIKGVEIYIEDHNEVPETNTLGRWRTSGVTGEVEVVPVLEGWKFQPDKRIMKEENSDVNFTGILTGLEVQDIKKDYTDYNTPRFTGRIKNTTSTTTFENIGITFQVYKTSDQKNIIDEAWDLFLAVDGLSPQGTVKFEAVCFDLDSTDELEHYEYTLETRVQ